jgi:hypothetical protein
MMKFKECRDPQAKIIYRAVLEAIEQSVRYPAMIRALDPLLKEVFYYTEEEPASLDPILNKILIQQQ